MNIYIGKLSEQTTETDLQQAFEAFGQVTSATLIKDRLSGVSRGFGFVEMPAQAEAEAAVASLGGSEMRGQSIIVNETHTRSEDRHAGSRPQGGPRSS
jgi:RNA recognition motif-containing protein